MKLTRCIQGDFSFTGLIAIALFFSACSSDKTSSGAEEGIIEFETKAVDETHPLYGFAPSTATLKFKGDQFLLEMSTMGMFNNSIIGNTTSKTMVQTIKFMNIKQACIENEQDLIENNMDYPISIHETKETKKMLGLKCIKVKVTRLSDPPVEFDAWYTKDIGLENCNALTPYAPIKGVLLDYRIKKMGMEMRFRAKNYKRVNVHDNTFEVPASMKIVSREEMTRFFDELQ